MTTVIGEAAIGTVKAADAPWGDAWLVVILHLVSWAPAVVAAAMTADVAGPPTSLEYP